MLGQLIREIIMGHGFSVDRLEYLTAHLDKYVDDGRFPGCSCLVMRRGEKAYFQASGRRDVDRDLASVEVFAPALCGFHNNNNKKLAGPKNY